MTFLNALGFRAPFIERAKDFLLMHQHHEGFWLPYWWRSKYLATAQAVRVLTGSKRKAEFAATHAAIEYIVRNQSLDGSWDNGIDWGFPCHLSTANCLHALTTDNTRKRQQLLTVKYLLSAQDVDGAWSSRACLHIPPPHVLEPHSFSQWILGGAGVGSCSVDQRRVLTTASVVASILSYIRK